MDDPTRAIVDFSLGVDFGSLSGSCVAAVVRNYVDGIGCAAGGARSRPARVAAGLASQTGGAPEASVIGMPSRALVEYAAFANGCALRHLDYNDDLLSAFHPSDMVGALTAIAESLGATGRDLISALAIAYEVGGAIAAAVPLRSKGWDQGLFCSLGTVAGLGYLMKLTPDQLANAVALAITPSIPLRVARVGELSMWKGCATPAAAMSATFATRLAQAGMTGPPHVFDGVDGLFKQVTGPFQLGRIGRRDGWTSAPERTMLKYFPADQTSQSAIELALELRGRCGADDIEAIAVRTFHLAWHEVGGGQGDSAQKWDPENRETADHSMAYVIAVALVDGAIDLRSFTPQRVRDPLLRPLMKRISIAQDEALTARHEARDETPVSLRVTLKDGTVIDLESQAPPRGHPDNPMTESEVNRKFDSMVVDVLEEKDGVALRDQLWQLASAENLDDICGLLRRFRIDGA